MGKIHYIMNFVKLRLIISRFDCIFAISVYLALHIRRCMSTCYHLLPLFLHLIIHNIKFWAFGFESTLSYDNFSYTMLAYCCLNAHKMLLLFTVVIVA